MVYTGTTNDDHGGKYFMSLYTVNVAQISMERGTNRWWRNFSSKIISCGRGFKKMIYNYPMFEWAPGFLITDYLSDEDAPIR